MVHRNNNVESSSIIDTVLDIGVSDFIVDSEMVDSTIYADELVCINSVITNTKLIGARFVIIDSILRDFVLVAPSFVSYKSELSGEVTVREDIFFSAIADNVKCQIGGVYVKDFPQQVFEIKGAPYRVYLHKDGTIEIGCIRNTIDKWLKAGKRYAQQLNMQKEEIEILYDFVLNLKNDVCKKQR